MSSNSNSSSTASGLGLADIVAVVFVILKLTHVIDWSWWWVLSPIWISLGIVLVILLFALIIAGLSN
jgi:membrane protein YdbS with pleckstrin-like domain